MLDKNFETRFFRFRFFPRPRRRAFLVTRRKVGEFVSFHGRDKFFPVPWLEREPRTERTGSKSAVNASN